MEVDKKYVNWDKIKSFLINAIAGAILISILGFTWFGWVSGDTALKASKQSAEEAVKNRLANICVNQFNNDQEKEMKFKEFTDKRSWERREYIDKQGWATMPGDEKPDNGVTDKCSELLGQVSQKAS